MVGYKECVNRLKNSDACYNMELLLIFVTILFYSVVLFILSETGTIDENSIVTVFGRTINGGLWHSFILTLSCMLISCAILLHLMTDYIAMVYAYLKMSDLDYIYYVLKQLTELEFNVLLNGYEDALKNYLTLHNYLKHKNMIIHFIMLTVCIVINLINSYCTLMAYVNTRGIGVNLGNWYLILMIIQVLMFLTIVYVFSYSIYCKVRKESSDTNKN